MAGSGTIPTESSVADFLASAPGDKRADALILDALFRRVTGFEPRMWGPSMVGYGRYDYTYATGHSGSSLATGFSPRKAEFSIYCRATPILALFWPGWVSTGSGNPAFMSNVCQT